MHNDNGPWVPSREEELSVQLFLNDLSDHQRAVTHVLAHRQVGQLFKCLRFETIDPESDIYQEQLNLTIMTMVGGGMVMSHETQATTEDLLMDNNTESNAEACQLHDVADRIALNRKMGKIKPFNFATDLAGSTKGSQGSPELSHSPTRIKQEEITPNLHSPSEPLDSSNDRVPTPSIPTEPLTTNQHGPVPSTPKMRAHQYGKTLGSDRYH